MNFVDTLRARWCEADSMLCVGIDPEPARLPAALRGDPDALFAFCRAIVDATADVVCCFKPQFALFAAQSGEEALQRLIAHIHARHSGVPVILDGKRGDIGSTAEHYAAEAFDRYGADAVTVNPYLGRDAAQPFLDRADKGVIVLCRTSNPGARDFQDLCVAGNGGDDSTLYQHVAERVARDWNDNGNCALVVGATYPRELADVRARVGELPLLIPGIGAQGGDIEAAVRSGRDRSGLGLILSSSRGVIYASAGDDFAAAARAAAVATRDAINRCR